MVKITHFVNYNQRLHNCLKKHRIQLNPYLFPINYKSFFSHFSFPFSLNAGNKPGTVLYICLLKNDPCWSSGWWNSIYSQENNYCVFFFRVLCFTCLHASCNSLPPQDVWLYARQQIQITPAHSRFPATRTAVCCIQNYLDRCPRPQ